MHVLRASLLTALLTAGLMGCADPAPVAADASADVTPDASADGAAVSFVAMTTLTTLNQNCMPAVPRDPLTVMGTVSITNTGTVPLGPITIDRGLVVQLLGGATLATFGVTPVTIAAIAPRATGTATFTKATDTLAGDAGVAGCQIVPCGSPIRVALELRGTNLPDSARAASEPGTLPCTH